jgi:hypothetical protein
LWGGVTVVRSAWQVNGDLFDRMTNIAYRRRGDLLVAPWSPVRPTEPTMAMLITTDDLRGDCNLEP